MKKIILLLLLIPNLVMGQSKIGYDMSLISYINHKNDERVLKQIDTIGSTIGWANSFLEANGRKPIYCDPSNIALNGYNYVNFLEEFLAKRPEFVSDASKLTLIMAVIFALEDKFPCN